MTATLERPQGGAPVWSSMPGWTIVGDLTPPELINARRLHTLRRLIFVGLGIVVVLCAVAYGYAMIQHSRATDDLDSASAQTTQLQLETNKYSGITRIESTVAGVKAQIASVMLNDVDTAGLVARLRKALPGTMSIESLNINITGASATANAAGSSSSLDLSGNAIIGAVTISGSGQHLSDVSAYVDNLSRLPGLANIVPTSNEVQNHVAHFTIMFALTDRLYSHHFDVNAKGGK
jgi:hypothetical protein